MSGTQCVVCGARTDAFLCKLCLREVTDALDDLPDLVDALVSRVALQSRTYRETRGLRRVDLELAELEEEYAWRRAAMPVALRTSDGRVTLPQTAHVVDVSASDLLAEVGSELLAVARDLAERRGAPFTLPTGRTEGAVCAGHIHDWTPVKGCGHRTDPETGDYSCQRLHCGHESCRRIRRGDRTGTAASLVRWLLFRRESIRLDEAAAEIHTALLLLRDRLAWAVDSSPAAVYVGPCRAEHGDGESRWCCARDVYRHPGAEAIVCDGHRGDRMGCGAEHDPLRREQWLCDQIEDALVPMEALRSFAVGVLKMPWPPAASVRSWRFRGRFDARSIDRNGAELFRGGDVLDLVRDWGARQADVRAVLASG